MDDPFIWVRAIHFAATILVSGVVLFTAFIAEPAFRKADGGGEVAAEIYSRLTRLAWTGLVIGLASGAAWLFYVAARIADLPLEDTFTSPVVWTVIKRTDFGLIWIVRLVLTGLVAISLRSVPDLRSVTPYWTRFLTVLLAAALVGTLAWSGHAAAGSGFAGAVHLASDSLHLIAAAAWIGALLPLAVMLGAMARSSDQTSAGVAREAVLRFSTLGIAGVGTLVATGIVNSWMLVGSVAALVGTNYGRLLLVKIALFLCMLTIAGVNRVILTPDLLGASPGGMQLPLRQLRNNSLIEAALGAVIVIVVGMLGALPPGIQELAAR